MMMNLPARSPQATIVRGPDGIVHFPAKTDKVRASRTLPDDGLLHSALHANLIIDKLFWKLVLEAYVPVHSPSVHDRSTVSIDLVAPAPPLTEMNLNSATRDANCSLFDSFSADGRLDAKGLSGMLGAFGTPCSEKLAEALIRAISTTPSSPRVERAQLLHSTSTTSSLSSSHTAASPGSLSLLAVKATFTDVSELLRAISLVIASITATQSMLGDMHGTNQKPTLGSTSPRRVATPLRRAMSPAKARTRADSPHSACSAATRKSCSPSRLPASAVGSMHSHTLNSARKSPMRTLATACSEREGYAPSVSPSQSPSGYIRSQAKETVFRHSPIISPASKNTPSRTFSAFVPPPVTIRSPRPSYEAVLENRQMDRRLMDPSVVRNSPARSLTPRNSIGILGVWSPKNWK